MEAIFVIPKEMSINQCDHPKKERIREKNGQCQNVSGF